MTKEEENKIIISDELQKNCSLDKWETVKITVQIPSNFSARAGDHHEFSSFKYYLNEWLGLSYEFEEVGCSGDYEAVFYTGPKPENLIKKIRETYE
jgi:hypothetical protein